MKKSLLAFIICFVSSASLYAQNQLLFTEDFQLGGGSFTLNSGGPGSNTGANNWILNNVYSGAPTYQNTMPEDSTYSGTIAFAPYSTYLHIHNSNSGIDNCNYDPSTVSDNFAYMTAGICTRGMDSVHFSFFYLCEGNPGTAWGECYYSRNGGPWVSTGNIYNNKYKWKYEDISDPAFANCDDLRFGFRWQNAAGVSPDSVSFAIDDINMVGYYSGAGGTIVVDSVSPNPVCQGGFLLIYWHLTDTLCDGTYAIDLSGPTGVFNTTWQWVAGINNPQMSGVFAIILPTAAGPGNCYKVRIRRTSPAPQFTGIASGCFSIIACPNVITTLQPVVTFDSNAVCVGSAIDVPFYSTGVYGANNVYTAQLSDSNGVFSSTPPIIGSSPDPSSYDPSLGSPPGTVSGQVPNVPPGCGYYIRVVSSNPPTIGAPWGPFCIQDCDLTTNNTIDLDFCVTDCAVAPQGADSIIDVDVNSYTTNAVYAPGNVFTTQLMSSMTFAQIGSNGILGSVAATGDTVLDVHVPCKDSLPIYGIPRGMNYMRVIGTQSNYPDSALGSLIRVTIGAPDANPHTITSYDFTTFTPADTFCVGDIVALFFSPYNYSDMSTYLWTCSGINSGQPFVSPSGANSNSLYVSLGGPGILTFTVQETNYGCPGPWSTVHTIVVIPPPNPLLTGPHNVCEGDTNTWNAVFVNSTYYSWTANGGAVIDTSNNVIDISYPNTGNYSIVMNAINMCGSATNTFTVQVNAYPIVTAGNDTVICSSSPVTLTTPTGTGYTYQWNNGSSNFSSNNSVIVQPTVTTTYVITTTFNPGACKSRDTVVVFVNDLADTLSSTVAGCSCDDGTAMSTPSGGYGPYTYSWSNGQTTPLVGGLTPGLYTVTITDSSGCTYTATTAVTCITSLAVDAGVDVTIQQGDQTILNGSGGTYYSWAPATGLSCTNCPNPTAQPNTTTTYTLTVSDSLGCTQVDIVTVTVEVDCQNVFVPNAFSPNEDGQNDVLYCRADPTCYSEFEFSVFNRWGECVFRTTDPTVGWDGYWRGVKCEPAVFNWMVKATLQDGTGLEKSGNVSLVK